MIYNAKLACVAFALLASIGSGMVSLLAQGYPLKVGSGITVAPTAPAELTTASLAVNENPPSENSTTFSVMDNNHQENNDGQYPLFTSASDSIGETGEQNGMKSQFGRTNSPAHLDADVFPVASSKLNSANALSDSPQLAVEVGQFEKTEATVFQAQAEIDGAPAFLGPKSSATGYESTTLPAFSIPANAENLDVSADSGLGPDEAQSTSVKSSSGKPFKSASFSVVEPPQDRKFRLGNSAGDDIPRNTLPSGGIEAVPMSDDLSLSPPPEPGIPAESFLPIQPPAFGTTQPIPNFDPGVGHRRPQPIQRAKIYPLDDGEKFDFETKKRDFPPFDEIIATGRFFYCAEILWAEPQFQGNTAIATEAVNFGQSVSSDFDSDFHPRVRFGFESQYGPGVEFSYFNINSNSEIASFTSDGNVVGHTNAWVIGRNVWSRIFADDPGEFLASQHSIDIDSATISFFKELKFPISRVNGNFGFQYVSIAQQLNANVTSASGATVETLQSTTDMRAFGPRAIIEYYRPIGHTPLELVTSFGGSVLFGQRDQFVSNSQTGLENRLGADEFLTIIDFLAAVQYKKTIGENRSWYARFGFMNQTWIGGGTAAFPQGDFGLRGLTFGIGYNR